MQPSVLSATRGSRGAGSIVANTSICEEGLTLTLITAAANLAYVVQVSDRRLTAATVPAGEQTKSIHLKLPDADFLVGYTGLARVFGEPMNRLLMGVLGDSATAAKFEAAETLRQLGPHLDQLFASTRVQRYGASDRRFTIMVTGFIRYSENRYNLAQCLWSNFQVWGVGDAAHASETFNCVRLRPKMGEEWPTLLQRIGQYQAWRAQDLEAIRPLLAKGRPPQAARDKILSVLPGQSLAYPTVGTSANAAVLTPDGLVDWTYQADGPSWLVHVGDQVVATPERTYYMADQQIALTDSLGARLSHGRPMVVPRVPMQRPCPCDSGLRYRQCHGKR